MTRQRLRRGDPVPEPGTPVLRGLTSNEGQIRLNREALIDAAGFNHQLYGFWGISVWLAQGTWSVDRILDEKLSRAPFVAVFLAEDLFVQGLELWDTGRRPHYDVTHLAGATAEGMADRLLAARHKLVNNEAYTPDPAEGT